MYRSVYLTTKSFITIVTVTACLQYHTENGSTIFLWFRFYFRLAAVIKIFFQIVIKVFIFSNFAS